MATARKNPNAQRSDPGEELVDVMLFKDNGKYKDDVFVCVNGENCVVQRGKPVKIKRKFAEVLRQSMEQDASTAQLIERESRSFQQATSALG